MLFDVCCRHLTFKRVLFLLMSLAATPVTSVDATQCFHPRSKLHFFFFLLRSSYEQRDAILQATSVCIQNSTAVKVSHLAEEDGAEQEDGVEEQQTQTQPPIQLPAV